MLIIWSEAGDELTEPRVSSLFSLAAFESLAAGKAFKVDNNDVAALSGSVLNGEDFSCPQVWVESVLNLSSSTATAF